MKTISTDELARWLDAGEPILLVDVLPEASFERQHIPGAVNVPSDAPDFAERVEQHRGSDAQRVVVYCADEACNRSPTAARKLDEAGFRKVFDYEQGIAGYRASGRETVGAGS